MRRLITTALVALAVVAIGACGGSSTKTTPAANAGNTGGNQAAAGDSGDFCKQFINLSPASVTDDPTGAKAAAETLKKLNPPSQIAGQWQDYLKALDEIASTDQNDKAKLAQIAVSHSQSLAAVGLFISQSCTAAFSASIPNYSTPSN